MGTALYSISQQSGGTFVPVTDAMLENPDPADWLMWRRTLNGWGYSPLDQINATNVRNLRMAWTRGMGPGIQEATPLVYPESGREDSIFRGAVAFFGAHRGARFPGPSASVHY